MRFVKNLLCCALLWSCVSYASSYKLYFNEDSKGTMCVSASEKSSGWESALGKACDKVNQGSIVRTLIYEPEVRASGTKQLVRPVFILDGIYLSTDEVRSLNDFKKDVDEFGIMEMFSNLGYTPILVQFSETVTRSIEENAEWFKKLLEYFNSNKHIDFPSAVQDGYIVLGISQGGIIGRYGAYLYDIKRKKTDAPIRLYASLDSPHQGAVMPIGLLLTIDFWANEGGAAAAEAYADLISSPGASDLLIRDEASGYKANTDTTRFLFGKYRKACEYKGFPSVLVAQGQMKGAIPKHPDEFFRLNRRVKWLKKVWGRAESRMYPSQSKNAKVAYNRIYVFNDKNSDETKNDDSPLDFIQGSVYPFARTMYKALRKGFLDEMPDDFKMDIGPVGVTMSSSWDEDSLVLAHSTFIPTASAMDLNCNGNLAMREQCAYSVSASGFPFEAPGKKTSADKVYAVDPTHPRYAEAMSGRHIESPVNSDGSIDTLVLRGMQTDIWRVLCEMAKLDYDTSLGEFRNPNLTGMFSPKNSCMDRSKIPDVVKNSGMVQKKSFPYVRYAFDAKTDENTAKFSVPNGWQKSVWYDNGTSIPPNSIFEVEIMVSNPKSNWMKAELILQRTRLGAGVQLHEIEVPVDGKKQLLRWQMPASASGLANYRWFTLVLNSNGATVTLSNPKLISSSVNAGVTPPSIKSAWVYPSSYAFRPWSSNVSVENYSDKLGKGLSFVFNKRFDGAYVDFGSSVSLDKYSKLLVTYWPGTCQNTRLYFDSKVIKLPNLTGGNVQNNFVVKILQLSDLIDTDMTPDFGFAVSRLNLQGYAAGERCMVKSIELR